MNTAITSVPIFIWGILVLLSTFYFIYKIYKDNTKGNMFFKILFIILYIVMAILGITYEFVPLAISKIIFFYIVIPLVVIIFGFGSIYKLLQKAYYKNRDKF